MTGPDPQDYAPALVMALAHRDHDTTRLILDQVDDQPALLLAAAITAAHQLTPPQLHAIAHQARTIAIGF